LGECSLPGDGKGEHERVESRVVEAFAEVAACRHDHCRVARPGEPLDHPVALSRPDTAVEHAHVWDGRGEHGGESLQMVAAVREDERRAAILDGFDRIGDDELTARVVFRELPVDLLDARLLTHL